MSIHDELIARIMGVHNINVHVVDIYLSPKILLFANVQFDVFKYIISFILCVPLTYRRIMRTRIRSSKVIIRQFCYLQRCMYRELPTYTICLRAIYLWWVVTHVKIMIIGYNMNYIGIRAGDYKPNQAGYENSFLNGFIPDSVSLWRVICDGPIFVSNQMSMAITIFTWLNIVVRDTLYRWMWCKLG